MARRPFDDPSGEGARALPREPTEEELWAAATRGARPVAPGPAIAAPPPPAPAGPHPGLDEADPLRGPGPGEPSFELSGTDEQLSGRVAGLDSRILRALRRGDHAVEGRLDLHGLNREEARLAVERFLLAARGAGQRCVVVVHGRGLHSRDQLPVLREALRGWLASGRLARSILAFATARPADGGAGALYVLLRRPGR